MKYLIFIKTAFNKIANKSFGVLELVVLGIIVISTLSYALAWNSPSGNPPAGNTDAPLNIGGSGQIKSGGLSLGAGLNDDYNGLIVQGGKVGIGTTSPGAKLDVRGGGIRSAFGLPTGWGNIPLGAGNNSAGGYSFEWDGDTGMFALQDGALDLVSNAFRTIQIRNDRVGINLPFLAYPTGDLDVRYGGGSRKFVLQDDGNAVIYDSGDATLWNAGTGSSIRWKEDIHPIEKALEKALKLRGVYFNWKDGRVNPFTGNKADVGFIAEEVGVVLPEIVSYDKDGSGNAAALDYNKLTPLLVEAIKEQQVQIEMLKQRISILEEVK